MPFFLSSFLAYWICVGSHSPHCPKALSSGLRSPFLRSPFLWQFPGFCIILPTDNLFPEIQSMREIQFREALREAMSEEMRRDPSVFLMGEEVAEYNGAYKVSQGMLDEFGPERVIDTPIAELGFAGIGVGAAMNGLRPIIEFMTYNFSLVAIDQVINSAAKILSMSAGQYGAPIVFRGPTGNAGMLGAQHSQNFENWYANTPGLKVVVPSNPYYGKGLLKSSIRDNDPVIFMESELMYSDKGQVPEEEYLIPIGKAYVVREGTDVTLVSFGKMMKVAFGAAQELEKAGVSAEVIDLCTVRPIDYATVVESVKKTNRLVIVEEAWPLAAISAELAYHVQRHAFDYLDAPVRRINSMDVPLPYAPTLIEAILPNVKRTLEAVNSVMYR
ncbi:MAG TPA: pyruvate dehydrogenase complex E1 component subunit beta [Cytophagales bacterium]